MRCFNQAFFMGRIVGDPETRVTQQTGKTLTVFSLAVQRDWYVSGSENDPPTDFFRVVAWGKFAEFCARILKKGMGVFVGGHMLTRTYEGKNGRQYAQELSLTNLHILTWPKGASKSSEEELPASQEEMVDVSDDVVDATMEVCSSAS